MYKILQLDQQLFFRINSNWHHPILDATLPLMRHQLFWVPLYLFLILMVVRNYKTNAWWWVAFAIATAVLTDFVSSDLIKKNVVRLRPCNDPLIADQIRYLLSYKLSSSSFTSSHATNHFGQAAFIFFTLKPSIGKIAWWFFVWAGIIVYAQVYVGVHYPLDIICGGLVGFFFGYLSAKSFNKNYSLR
ncbi:MAG: phosphatase PAP2 family protein [Ferruginibacter sp.]